jgi:hypothetical protein
MGYLIEPGIKELTVTIPEATVQTMDLSSPFMLIQNSSLYICPIYCYVSLINSTTAYSGFNHLHLTNTGQYTSTYLAATLNENALNGGIQKFEVYGMLINIQQVAEFGGVIGSLDLEIFFDTIPISGDGDMIVNIGYKYFRI